MAGECCSSRHDVVALAISLLCSLTGGAIVQAIALRFGYATQDPLALSLGRPCGYLALLMGYAVDQARANHFCTFDPLS